MALKSDWPDIEGRRWNSMRRLDPMLSASVSLRTSQSIDEGTVYAMSSIIKLQPLKEPFACLDL